MNDNTSVGAPTHKKSNYGTTSFVGGIMQIIFGFSTSILPIAIFLITIVTAVFSFAKEKNDSRQKKFAMLGVVLACVMVLVYFVFGVAGIVGVLTKNYVP